MGRPGFWLCNVSCDSRCDFSPCKKVHLNLVAGRRRAAAGTWSRRRSNRAFKLALLLNLRTVALRRLARHSRDIPKCQSTYDLKDLASDLAEATKRKATDSTNRQYSVKRRPRPICRFGAGLTDGARFALARGSSVHTLSRRAANSVGMRTSDSTLIRRAL